MAIRGQRRKAACHLPQVSRKPILVSHLRRYWKGPSIDESNLTSNISAYSEVIALAILVVGFIVARIAGSATGSALDLIDRNTARYTTTDASLLSPALIRLSRGFVFWVVFILAVVFSLRVLGVGGISSLLNSVIAFTPRVLIAFSIVVAGYLIGIVARHLLTRAVSGFDGESIGPRLLQGTIVSVAVVMGLQQIGVDISFITQLVLILVATVSAGLMLAFALGARQHVANLLARHELERLAIGQLVRVADVEGSIVDIYTTGIDVATDDGVASIPAARIAEFGVTKLAEGDGDD